jgi:glutathione S-transferase
MPEISLLQSPGSCSRISLIALEEIGLDYRIEQVLLARGEQNGDAFRGINPKGKVPVLIVDGMVLTETIAILTFLARKFPQAGLLPTNDDWAEVNALSLLSWCATGMHPLITRLRHPQKFCELVAAHNDIRRLGEQELSVQLQLADQRLASQPWIAAAAWTVVDAYIAWIWGRSLDAGINPRDYPHIHEHHARTMARPSSLRALAREEAR